MQHLGSVFAPFQQIGAAFVNVGKNMIFIGKGDVFDPTQINAIIDSHQWALFLLLILSQMNLITSIFNIIPLPPLDG
jgi:Zn-dependent protease